MRTFLVLVYVGVALLNTNEAKSPKRAISNPIQNVVQPVEETISTIGSRHCEQIKKLFGVQYGQVKKPDMNKLKLQLRTNGSSTEYDISVAAEAIPKSKYVNWNKKLVIFIHGFIDSPSLFAFNTISESFLNEGKTILALDCSRYIRWLYLRSSTYARFIGEKLGSVLASMVKNGISPEDIHLIGHSLGAQIAGFTGKKFYELTHTKVSRISGLDPAGPCFTNLNSELKLSKTDAQFVDIIHTGGGVFGHFEPIGHVDFYPNGGKIQPACGTIFCNHCRAVTYYAESVTNPKGFPAVQCDKWEQFENGECTEVITYMGYFTKPTSRGMYYLRTNDESPFGLGKKGLVEDDSNNLIR